MKNVLLVGDSIRIGYDKSVALTLEGKANVCFPKENCRFASFVLNRVSEIRTENINISSVPGYLYCVSDCTLYS